MNEHERNPTSDAELPIEARTQAAVETFIKSGDEKPAIAYLKQNPSEVSEFCILVKESYANTDSTTPILRLARLIEVLL
jgi:hypothetical protein